MKISRPLTLIILFALALRIAILIAFVRFPGVADPNHYYNMGVRLVEGHGFTIDYIWQYNLPPDSIEHPEEHWMPLAALIAAAPMVLFGQSVPVALIGFIAIGSLLPLLSYFGAAQLGLKPSGRYFAALATAVVPEMVLNSLRTDTTIPFAFLTCASILLLVHGLQRNQSRAFILSGISAGLAHLTRNDGVLLFPMLLVTLIAYRLWADPASQLRRGISLKVALMPLVALIVVTPWLIRNLTAFGLIGSPETSDMFFFTHHDDHYAYGRAFTLETMLAAQTPAQIIGKRLFEMAAGANVMIMALDVALPVAVLAGGVSLIVASRKDRSERERLLTLAPALILLLGAFVAYTVFIPYKSQAGSFKKMFLALIPLIVPLGALAYERAITDERLRRLAVAITLAIMTANAAYLVRTDSAVALSYMADIQRIAQTTATLDDTNADGKIILMVQDPYILRYVGIQSVMYPYENRDVIAEVAARYGVDYLLMPPNRPALDPLLNGSETDSRYAQVAEVQNTFYTFWAVTP